MFLVFTKPGKMLYVCGKNYGCCISSDMNNIRFDASFGRV